MTPGSCQRFIDGSDSRFRLAVDNRKIQVRRVSVTPDVDEPEGGSALEYQAASVRRGSVVQLGDDVREDVVAFGDQGVNSVSVGSLRDGMAGQHDYWPTTARSSSAATFHATRKVASVHSR